MEEIWKDVVGWEGFYMVSNLGNFKRLPKKIIRSNGFVQTFKERKLKPSLDKDGYVQYSLAHIGYVIKIKGHREVVKAFIGDIPKQLQINHKNGIKNDNRVSNLEIVTQSENVIHSYKVLNRKLKGAVVDNNREVIAFSICKRKSQKCPPIINKPYKEFRSITEASVYINKSTSGISGCLVGKQKTAGGFIWKYK